MASRMLPPSIRHRTEPMSCHTSSLLASAQPMRTSERAISRTPNVVLATFVPPGAGIWKSSVTCEKPVGITIICLPLWISVVEGSTNRITDSLAGGGGGGREGCAGGRPPMADRLRRRGPLRPHPPPSAILASTATPCPSGANDEGPTTVVGPSNWREGWSERERDVLPPLTRQGSFYRVLRTRVVLEGGEGDVVDRIAWLKARLLLRPGPRLLHRPERTPLRLCEPVGRETRVPSVAWGGQVQLELEALEAVIGWSEDGVWHGDSSW